MPSSVIAHVGSGCRIVGAEVLAAAAPARFVLNASWFTWFNCRFAVLRGHVRLHCGLGGLHEGVAVCPGGQGDTGPLFHRGILFYGPSHLRQFGCQRFGPVVLLLQRLPQFRRRAVDRLLELHRLVVLRQWRLLRHDRRDQRNELGYLLLTSVSRHIGGDFSVEIHADERRRDQGCGNREKRKQAMTARSTCRRRRVGEAARQTVPLLKIIFPRHWIPTRRRCLARFAVFSDPLTGLRQPTSDIIVPLASSPRK